jgi:hypothetical protein
VRAARRRPVPRSASGRTAACRPRAGDRARRLQLARRNRHRAMPVVVAHGDARSRVGRDVEPSIAHTERPGDQGIDEHGVRSPVHALEHEAEQLKSCVRIAEARSGTESASRARDRDRSRHGNTTREAARHAWTSRHARRRSPVAIPARRAGRGESCGVRDHARSVTGRPPRSRFGYEPSRYRRRSSSSPTRPSSTARASSVPVEGLRDRRDRVDRRRCRRCSARQIGSAEP